MILICLINSNLIFFDSAFILLAGTTDGKDSDEKAEGMIDHM